MAFCGALDLVDLRQVKALNFKIGYLLAALLLTI